MSDWGSWRPYQTTTSRAVPVAAGPIGPGLWGENSRETSIGSDIVTAGFIGPDGSNGTRVLLMSGMTLTSKAAAPRTETDRSPAGVMRM